MGKGLVHGVVNLNEDAGYNDLMVSRSKVKYAMHGITSQEESFFAYYTVVCNLRERIHDNRLLSIRSQTHSLVVDAVEAQS
jgi:predicted nucleic acid-binding OB-fold protein